MLKLPLELFHQKLKKRCNLSNKMLGWFGLSKRCYASRRLSLHGQPLERRGKKKFQNCWAINFPPSILTLSEGRQWRSSIDRRRPLIDNCRRHCTKRLNDVIKIRAINRYWQRRERIELKNFCNFFSLFFSGNGKFRKVRWESLSRWRRALETRE